MDHQRRTDLAAQIINNPLWKTMKEELPRYYYENFRAATDPEARDRLAMAHDIFDDVIEYMEAQAAMGSKIDDPLATGDGDPNE